MRELNGYFAPDDGRNGLFFFPVSQCRLSDTRGGNAYTGAFGGPIFANDETRTIPVASSGKCPVPATAKAWTVNTTVIPNGNPMPYLTIWPSGQGRPNASIINAFEGQTVTGAAIIPAGTNGSLDVFTYRQTHVVLELSGYFGR